MSALLDGQLSPQEEERAWTHVQGCHSCRDLVEAEGWTRSRLRGLSLASGPALSDSMKGSLRGGPDRLTSRPTGPWSPDWPAAGPAPRRHAMVALGGGVGAAALGVLALVVAPGSAPAGLDRQGPTASISRPAGNGAGQGLQGARTSPAVRRTPTLQGSSGIAGATMVP